MHRHPFTYSIGMASGIPDCYERHITRSLSAMRGQYHDGKAYEALLARVDMLVYDVYAFEPPEESGDLMHGVSVLHAGKVGDEYFMTRGHFHAELATAEVYQCLAGEGMMVMETMQGEWSVAELRPGTVLYVPPGWAHRSVNTASEQDFVEFFVCPSNAGHDYRTIETRGFRKLVVEHAGRPQVVDNPRWLAPERR
jgi:glucose-6-phosphate isomerase, archaeal